jgi:hypothetical protein
LGVFIIGKNSFSSDGRIVGANRIIKGKHAYLSDYLV